MHDQAHGPGYDEVAALRREVRALKRGAGALAGVTLVTALATAPATAFGAFASGAPQNPGGQVLRVRGLVVEDAAGRPRILLGAPVPAVAGRRRRDAGAATVAMVVLGPSGADRLVVGYGPDPMAGGQPLPRQAEGVGVFLHDTAGDERGGYDFIATGKAVMTLDRPTGEGVAAVVDDRQGFAGLAVFHPSPLGRYREAVTLGSTAARGGAPAEAFLKAADTTGTTRARLAVTGVAAPTLRVQGADGRTTRDLSAP